MITEIVLNKPDAQMVKPRYLYVRVDYLSKMEEYDGRKLSVNRNEIYRIATTTILPYSYVKMLLLENDSDIIAEDVIIECLIYRDPLYQERNYKNQRMVLDKKTIPVQKTQNVHYTILRKEDGIMAIPCKITEPIMDNDIEQLRNSKSIIAEIDFLDHVIYKSSSRESLPWFIRWLKPKVYSIKIADEMNDPKIFGYVTET